MENFNFGTKPSMKEVPPGTEATFSFNGEPEIVETEYGEKFSFPITLHSHDSYSQQLHGDHSGLEMTWQSKCAAAKQLYNELTNDIEVPTKRKAYQNKLKQAYKERKWQLTRFDTGTYWLDVI